MITKFLVESGSSPTAKLDDSEESPPRPLLERRHERGAYPLALPIVQNPDLFELCNAMYRGGTPWRKMVGVVSRRVPDNSGRVIDGDEDTPSRTAKPRVVEKLGPILVVSYEP